MSDKQETKTLSNKAIFQILSIPIDQIIPSPHQARKMFDEDSIRILAESMKQEGLIQPITIRRVKADDSVTSDNSAKADNAAATGQGSPALSQSSAVSESSASTESSAIYELISGERRLRAAKLLGWPTIDARIIQTISPGESAAKGLIENLQREDLNPIEEAEGFDHLNKLSPDYWNQNQIAKVTGRTQGYVSQSISLLKLAPEIQENIRRLIFSRSVGLEIGRLDDVHEQRKVLSMLGRNPTVKTIRNRVDKQLGWKSRRVRKRGLPDPLAELWSQVLEDPTVAPECAWKVEYRDAAWHFSFSPHSASPISSLHDWFDKIHQALEPIAKK